MIEKIKKENSEIDEECTRVEDNISKMQRESDDLL